MIKFILIATPFVLLIGFFGTSFIRTNFFSFWKKKSNYSREKLLSFFTSYCFWLLFFLLISNTLLKTLGVGLGVETNLSTHPDWGINTTPFKTILTYHRYVSGLHYFTNVWGNILITIPIGALMPILWKKFQKPLTLFFSFFFILVLVETLQYFIGRSADIDDILLNLLGLFIGFSLRKKLQIFFPKHIYQR